LKQPLAGIRVLDLGMAAVGPIAAEYMGMLGADVIKVEQPTGDMLRRGDLVARSYGFTGNNHSKRGISLNLKDEGDRAIALDLVRSADILIENFRSAEILERLGLGWDVMSAANPRLIYLQSSAYGWGPMTGKPSNDWTSQAFAGATSVTGQPGGPREFVRNTSSLDWTGAFINLEAMLIALYIREKTGRGMRIQNSQLQSSLFTGITRLAEVLAGDAAPGPMGMARPNIVPDQAFATADGHITVSAPHNGFWAKLCRVIGREDLLADPRFASNRLRVANREALVPQLEAVFRSDTSDNWLARLRDADVPCGGFQKGPTLGASLREDPQVQAERLVTDLDSHWGPMLTAQPMWRFDKTEARITRPAPRFAEHQEEVIAESRAVSAGAL
jgi:CoA:oxalate CoA-transferase